MAAGQNESYDALFIAPYILDVMTAVCEKEKVEEPSSDDEEEVEEDDSHGDDDMYGVESRFVQSVRLIWVPMRAVMGQS